jgi:hypothetical protein
MPNTPLNPDNIISSCIWCKFLKAKASKPHLLKKKTKAKKKIVKGKLGYSY